MLQWSKPFCPSRNLFTWQHLTDAISLCYFAWHYSALRSRDSSSQLQGKKKSLCACAVPLAGRWWQSCNDGNGAVWASPSEEIARVAAALFVRDLSVCNSIPYLREHVDLGLCLMLFGVLKAVLFAQPVLLSTWAQHLVGQTLPACNQLWSIGVHRLIVATEEWVSSLLTVTSHLLWIGGDSSDGHTLFQHAA